MTMTTLLQAKAPARWILTAALGAGLVLNLSACNNKEGRERNKAEKSVNQTAEDIQQVALQAAYPTPMTDRQADEFAKLAGQPPEGLDDNLLRSLQANGDDRFQPLEKSKDDYQGIINKIGTITGTPQQQDALRAMRANANLGLAAIQLEHAERSDVAMRPDLALGNTMLTSVLDLNAMIASAQKFDPGPQRHQYDETGNAARAQLQQHQSEARNIQKQISDLEKRVATENSAAASLSEQAINQRDNALKAPLNDRIPQLEESKKTARRAGDHQVAAARLEAQLDLLRPELARYDMLVNQDQGQITDMDHALELLEEQTTEYANQIAQLRRDVGVAAGTFSSHFDPLVESFQSRLMPQFDAAREAAQAAADSAPRSGGALQSMAAKQLLGRIEWRRAMALSAMIQLVQRAVDNASALGRSSSDQTLLDNLKSMESQARTAAQEALQEALDALENAPSSGADMDRRMSDLRASLRDSIAYITGQAVATVRDLSDVPDNLPIDEPVTSLADTSGPLGLLKTAQQYETDGDFAALFALYYSSNPDNIAQFRRAQPALDSIIHLDKVCRAAFGNDWMEKANSAGGGDQAGGPAGITDMGSTSLAGIDIDQLKIRFDGAGTTAWVDNEPRLADQNMILVDGKWYFEISDQMAAEMKDTPDEFLMFFVAIFDSLAQKVENGEITDPAKLGEDIFQGVFEEMMKNNPDLQNSPFGPGGGRQRDRNGGGN